MPPLGLALKSSPSVSMTDTALCRAFNLTVSTKDDISEEAIKKFKKWLTKTALYYYCVIECDTGKRHLHATMFFKEPKDKKKMRENIWDRYIKPHHLTSIGKVAVHLQACPGRKWFDEYLRKDDTREEVAQEVPEDLDDLNDYFPSEETQALFMNAKEKVLDVFYAQHEVVYKEWLSENTWASSTETAHEYFHLRMFVRKDMRVIADSRRVHQMAVALHRYSVESYKLTNLEISQHTKEHAAYDFSRP